MKRKFFVLLLVLCLMFMTSCHGRVVEPPLDGADGPLPEEGEYTPFDVPDSFDMTKEYTVTFWAKNESNVYQQQIYEKAVEDFEVLYPNIHIKYVPYTDYNVIYRDVIRNISTGTTPNVCITYPDHIATYKTGENVVVSLDELMADEKYGLGGSELLFDAPTRDEIIGKFLDEGVIDGHQYALPFVRSTEVCYINLTLLERLGYELPDRLTWEFLFEVSAEATKRGEDGKFLVNGQNTLIPFIYKSTDNMMIQMLAQKGAPYSTEDGEVLIFNDQTRDILFDMSDYAAQRAFADSTEAAYPGNYLNRGQCIFAIDSTAGATWMGKDAPSVTIPPDQLMDFEIAVMPLPQYDWERPKMISQGPSLCVFDKADEGEVLASWIFAQYLLTDGVQIDYASTEGYVPVTSRAQQSEQYLDYLGRAGEDNNLYYDVKIEATRILIENTANTFITPVFNGSANLRNAAGQMIKEVVNDSRIGAMHKTDAYWDKLSREMVAMYHIENANIDNANGIQTESVVLLSVIGTVWLGIGVFFVYDYYKKRKKHPGT